jgi:hypothetical protein
VKFQLRKRHLIPVAAAAVVASGALLFTAGADTVPNGIAATEAYSDSISSITALFGTPGAEIVGNPGTQVPQGGVIQFDATSTLNAFPGVHWTTQGLPGTFGFIQSGQSGRLTLPAVPLPSGTTDTFTVKVSELSPGLAQGFATVTVTPGSTFGDDTVTITLDLLNLQAPQNNGTSVTFNAVDTGGTTVTETMFNLPAGVTFSGNTLGVGTAVAGHYPLMIDHATDVQGAVATEGFTAVVRPFFAGVPVLYGGHANEGINASREDVFVSLRNVDACLHFQIVGPGRINGHEGWVPAHVGENEAFYGGLLQHHGYTVNYEAVTGPADCSAHSTTLWPDSHTGYVFFRTA